MNFVNEVFSLNDKVVVITGGGGIIARAMSEFLLKSEAKIILWDIKQENLNEAKNELIKKIDNIDDKIFLQVVDTTDKESISKAIEKAEKEFSAPNALINAAGGNRGKSPFVDTDLETFEFVLKLNLIAGLMAPTQVFAAYWINNNIKGSIINLASMSSYIPLSGVWAYDAAKAAVLNLTMGAAKEFAEKGIRVNAIAPGFFIGKQNKDLLIKNEKTGELTDRGQAVINHTPFKRFGDVSELGGATIFLLSDKASGFITGVSIPVDGGYLIDNI